MLAQVPVREDGSAEFKVEAPGGLVAVTARVEGGKAVDVALDSVPSFVGAVGVTVRVPEIGEVTVDIAYGGMWSLKNSCGPRLHRFLFSRPPLNSMSMREKTRKL